MLSKYALAQWGDDVQILVSTKDKFVVKYTPYLPGISKLQIDGKEQIVFEIKNCAYQFSSNQPILPGRKIIINVPEHATAVARVIDIREDFVHIDKITSTLHHYDNDFKKIIQRPNPDLDNNSSVSDSIFPKENIQLSQPGLLREQIVSELVMFPVRYNLAKNEFSICREMTVQVDFPSTPRSQTKEVVKDLIFENVYSGSIANHSTFPSLKDRKKIAQKIYKQTDQKQWFRIAINEEGIYRLGYRQLVDAGISAEDISSRKLHLYYGGGNELPQQIQISLPELREIPTAFFDNNNDGHFNENDTLIFYAQGTSGWKYTQNEWRHYINHYTNENVYWLCVESKPEKNIARRSYNRINAETLQAIYNFRDHIYEEQDKKLPDNSGLNWMWDVLKGTGNKKYSIDIADSTTQDSVILKVHIKGLSETHHQVDIYFNHQHLKSYDLSYTLATTINCEFPGELLTQKNELLIKLTGTTSSIGFDWYEMEYSRNLSVDDQELIFYSSGLQGLTKFSIDGFNEQTPYVFNISDPFEVEMLETEHLDTLQTRISFVDSIGVSDEKRYLVVTPNKFKMTPTLKPLLYDLDTHLKSTTNEADYLIITHESLLGSALDRLRDHRSNPRYWPHQDIPEVMVVTTQEIYDQFSFGLIDPVAIRNFLKYALENWQKAPSYVLLIGEATYDFKNNLGLDKTLLVPSFENRNQVSDDWFVNLTNDRFMDMMIGRLPVYSQEELAVVVDKIIRYDSELSPGVWRSRITLAADDIYRKTEYASDDYIFIRDSEILANSRVTQDFDIDKIYLERYPWDRAFNKPGAKEAFLSALNNGTLYLNFLGHANWNMLAHENMFRTPVDLAYLHNVDYLPMFYAGTCEVARLDDPFFTSMGEHLLLHQEGGVIACVGSARWAMHLASFNVGKAFYEKLFDSSPRGAITIGQALLQAKTIAGYPDQTEIMFLFGDPALRLAVPSYHIDLSVYPDTLSLKRRVIVKGKIKDSNNKSNNFSGYCGLRLYDSAVNYKNPLYSYLWQGKILFEGQTPVEDGEFETSFFSSADTTAGGTLGQLVACAWQKNQAPLSDPLHAAGALDSLTIAADSLSIFAKRDTVEPELKISIAGIRIESGTTEMKLTVPFLITGEIYDEDSGFSSNILSEPVIQLKIDGKIVDDFKQNLIIEFEYPDRKKAYFQYEVNNLQLGEHHLSITVYDQSLNAINWDLGIFAVSNRLTISNVLNYPNPASGRTSFTFELSQDAALKIKIYTVSGRCIRTIKGLGQYGFNVFPEEGWDCADQDGDMLANGVYLYKVIARAVNSQFIDLKGQTNAEVISKLVIIN